MRSSVLSLVLPPALSPHAPLHPQAAACPQAITAAGTVDAAAKAELCNV